MKIEYTQKAEVTFLDGTVSIAFVWKQNRVWVSRNPSTQNIINVEYIETYEGIPCFDEIKID